ncbi:hypothetical protein GOBAR_AA33933 [Gossypium barbadense]|uniref:RNase H type-1 domain-containing protein n=1 Tax=Gossypium barbadense TaxID=3634 RepID=A0A2P5W6P5_GOSBA|nr:hypothetical protein GOBAR_AA33933 [Gossypium barbadense]
MNTGLCAAISEGEVENAAGPDGFNGFFFQEFWDVTKGDVIRAVEGFFQSGRLLREMNCRELMKNFGSHLRRIGDGDRCAVGVVLRDELGCVMGCNGRRVKADDAGVLALREGLICDL